ncbi:MAG: winged helix-turn-helix domain-containing protein [Chloroflexota bacterium]
MNFSARKLETLRVVSDPISVQILEILIGHILPVRGAADKLGLSASILYYHFNLLEKHGLIQVVETRQASQPAGKRIYNQNFVAEESVPHAERGWVHAVFGAAQKEPASL